MAKISLTMSVLAATYAVCRMEKGEAIPGWAFLGKMFSITQTADELSIVCEQGNLPSEVQAEKGWRCLKVEGPLDFSMTGILSSLAGVLALEGISIFAISTYDTDYLLVKEENLTKALRALRANGVQFKNIV